MFCISLCFCATSLHYLNYVRFVLFARVFLLSLPLLFEVDHFNGTYVPPPPSIP